MGGKGTAATHRHSCTPQTVIPAPSTVIPAQAGIQNRIAKDRHTTNRAFLDSRLRGNDGKRATAPSLCHSENPHHVIPSVAEESENPEIESKAGFSDSSATLGMTL